MTFNWFEIADKLKSHPELVGAEDQKKINFSMSIYTSLGGGSSITCVGFEIILATSAGKTLYLSEVTPF